MRAAFRRNASVALAALFFAVAGQAVDAHEIGTTQVSATFRHDGTYAIDVTVDPDALLTRLEVAGGLPLSRGLDPTARDARIASLAEVFLRHMTVAFDT